MNSKKPEATKNSQNKPVGPNVQKKEAAKAESKKPFSKH